MNDNLKLIIRICTLLLIFIIPINIFQILFSKITLVLSYNLLDILGFNPILRSESIIIQEFNLVFVSACVATSAYYLLTALILLTKDIPLKKMALLFIFGSLLLLIMNIIRIDILIIILLKYGSNYFEKLHLLIWKFISSVFVAIVWVLLTYTLQIKSIPVYSDFISLIKKIKTK
jgi:exosortase/archaeosortase family protein